jgi:hypothetical protein
MKEFLSKDTLALLNKYDNAKLVEVRNDKEICEIDKGDLEFLLGYTEGSLRIERKLKDTLSKVHDMLLFAREAYGNNGDFMVNYKINEAIVTIEELKK